MLVVLAHAGVPGLSGGIIGVDVFFVLSGYLITGLLLAEHGATGRIRIVEFYARRLKRLLPALAAMLAIVLLAATALLSAGELREQTRSTPYAATWTSNLFFAWVGIDYFAELQTRDLFLHTWSLGVEEQYYLVWPLMLLAALRREPRQRRLLLALAALFVGSMALFAYWNIARPLWAFYQMPGRVWQFALGGATWVVLSARGHAVPSWAAGAAGVAGLALIVGTALALRPQSPGYWLLAPSLGAALVLGSGALRDAPLATRLLARPPLVWLGDRSYSWYLWHWPLLMLGAALGVRQPAGVATVLAASLALAVLSHAVIERPLWKGPRARRLSARRALVAAGALIGLVLAGPVWFASRVAGTPPAGEAAVAAAARVDVPELYALGCDSWFHSAEPRACLFGDAQAPRTAVLIGDSIGLQWFPLFRELFPEPEWRLAVLTKSACPMVDEDYFYARINAVFTVCRQWRDAVLTALPQLKPSVIVVGSGQYPFTPTQWVDGSARVLAYLRSVAPQVVVLAPTPTLSFDGPGCLERKAGRYARLALAGLGDCSEPLRPGGLDAITRYLVQAAAHAGGAVVLDLGDRVCPGATCAAQSFDGTVVFRDAQHLTATFARAQASVARERLASLGLADFRQAPSPKGG